MGQLLVVVLVIRKVDTAIVPGIAVAAGRFEADQ